MTEVVQHNRGDNRMYTDGKRLWDSVEALAEYTDAEMPFSRLPFSQMHGHARKKLEHMFRGADLEVRIDSAGNLIGRLEGAKWKDRVIMIGSHSDTVPGGGRFDGIAGILAGLELAHTLKDRGVRLEHSLEIVDFIAEEHNEFGVSCIGSRGMSGHLSSEHLTIVNDNGESLSAAIDRMGGNTIRLGDARRTDRDLHAFLELHIEQGPVLYSTDIEIGVVADVVGIRRMEVEVQGQANHAGTTPMNLRHDAMVAAADMVVAVNCEALKLDAEGKSYFVATVGRLCVSPNGANVVPGRVNFVIDARSSDDKMLERFAVACDAAFERICEERSTKYCSSVSTDSPSTRCNSRVVEAIASTCEALGASHLRMSSGAGHDAVFMGKIAPMGMLFVPSRAGISHSSEEWTEPAALHLGTEALYRTVLTLDKCRIED